jgi:N-methylhydantoinase A
MSEYRISVDTGGTFTDVVVTDSAGKLYIGKAPSTSEEPFRGVLDALEVASQSLDCDVERLLRDTESFVYATTASLNAILTGLTARTAFLTTAGHPDILTLREGGRSDPFDYRVPYGEPYVPRRLTFEVPERVSSEGDVLMALEPEAVGLVLDEVRACGVESIAVCLLWSIVNPTHERLVGQLIEERLPDVAYTLSHELNPILREYRRASSTAIDASLKPLAGRHFGQIEQALRAEGLAGRFLAVTSVGGMISASGIMAKPIYSVNSGPSMAPVAARAVAVNERAVIVCDAGGTSFDVSLVSEGQIRTSRDSWIGPPFIGHLTGVSAVDVRSIGAGGGSIAWVDPGGLIRVGPASAGAMPGPACYGFGGTKPTVTDAAAVLGHLDPRGFLDGRLQLQTEAASMAIDSHVAQPLGLSIEQAAEAILAIATESMVDAIREITVNQGLDPRESVIVGGGGAAGLNIARIAEELEVDTVLVPRTAGALSACGAQLSDYVMEFTLSRRIDTDRFDHDAANIVLDQLRARMDAFLEELDLSGMAATKEFIVEARYANQAWELDVPLPCATLGPEHGREIERAFDAVHKRVFAVSQPGEPVECVQWRGRVIAHVPPRELQSPPQDRRPYAELVDMRPAHFGASAWQQTPFYVGGGLPESHPMMGPAVIVEPTTTIVVPPGWSVELDPGAVYRLRRAQVTLSPRDANVQRSEALR